MNKITVIGGGLAGLSAAYHLGKKYNYEIYEKESKVGGLCRSEVFSDFTFDYGIHILYTRNPYVENLMKNALLKNNLSSQIRRSFVYYKGVFTKYPFQAYLYGQDPEIIKECVLGLIKARQEKTAPKNFKEWIYTTFGEGIAKHFMIPYNKKQWTIDLSKMDFNWIKERVPVPKIQDVLNGVLKIPNKKYGPNAYFWYPLKGGIEALPKSFLPHIKNLHLNTEVTSISTAKKMLELNGQRTVKYGKIISSLALPKIIRLIKEVPKEVKKAAEELEFNVIYSVNFGIDRPNISDKHWIYFPESKYIFHRISFPMNLSSYATPKGKSSITVEISTSKHKQVKKENLVERVIKDLIKIGILKKKDKIIIKKLLILDPAYVIYDLSHKKNVQKVHNFLKKNNIYPCGRFGEWEYLNMDKAILSGKKIAEALA